MDTFAFYSPRAEELTDFLSVLQNQEDITLQIFSSGDELLTFVEQNKPQLVIIDQKISEDNPLDLVIGILTINAMTNTAMITSMDEEQWHEKSEGLGMLPAIPDPPSKKDGQTLLKNYHILSTLI